MNAVRSISYTPFLMQSNGNFNEPDDELFNLFGLSPIHLNIQNNNDNEVSPPSTLLCKPLSGPPLLCVQGEPKSSYIDA